MTDIELLRRCIDAEYIGSDGFRVIANELIYKDHVELDGKFTARNIGQYPSSGITGEEDTTHLWIECSHVRKYLSRVRK